MLTTLCWSFAWGCLNLTLVCVCVCILYQDHDDVLELFLILFTIFVCNCVWHIHIFRCTCIQYKVIISFVVSLESNGPPLSAPQEGASLPSSKLRRLVVLGAMGCMIPDDTWYILLCHVMQFHPIGCRLCLYVLSLVFVFVWHAYVFKGW